MIDLRLELNPVPWSCGVSVDESLFVAAFRFLAGNLTEPLEGPLSVSWLIARRAPARCASSVGELVRGLEVAGCGVLWVDLCQLRAMRATLVASGPRVEPFIEVKISELATP